MPQKTAKSKLQKPCHDELEASSKRKQVKTAEKRSSSRLKLQDQNSTLEEAKNVQQATLVMNSEEINKSKTEQAPLIKQVPGSIIVPIPLIPTQLAATQKSFMPTNPNLKIQSLSQLLSQNIPQHLTQQYSQLPLQAQIDIQKNLLRSQELQMLNTIANNLYAQMRVPNSTFPRAPYFF